MLALVATAVALAGPFGPGGGPFGPGQQDRPLLGQTIRVADAVAADPLDILTSVSQDGLHIAAVLEDPTTVSDTPDEGACFSVDPRDVFGALHDVDPEDAFALRLWLGDTGLPPSTQVTATLTNGAMGAATVGFGVGLRYSANGPLVLGAKGNGSWANTVAAATDKLIAGAEMNGGANATAIRYHSHAIDTLGDPIATANTAPAADSISSSTTGYRGPYDTLSICVGWFDASGQAGAVVRANVDLLVLPAARVPSSARSVTVDTVHAIPRSVLIEANSNACGAASGTQDADYGGDSVDAGETAGTTYRSNGAAVTTWGVRPGIVPYLAEELIDAGVTNPKIVTDCGSGWAAGDILANLGRGYLDTYTADPTNKPDAILYQQHSGNVADQAAYDAFVVDFEKVLDRLESTYGVYGSGGPRIYVGTRTIDDDDAYPFSDQVLAEKQRQCAGDVRCVLVDLEGVTIDPGEDNHPTPGIDGGNDQIADRWMAAFQ